jgi:UDP-2-acetamido-2-deoxy-ribo-hexuluronate aminotransferase
MEFIDLSLQQKRIKDKINLKIQNVLTHGIYIMGPEVKKLEEKLANYVNIKNAIACASGTDALLLALMAYGVGHGDAIFTTPFTFIATAEVISLLGATPIFVDIDPQTFNLDPAKLEQAIQAHQSSENEDRRLNSSSLERSVPATSNLTPRGIIAVDLFGLPADYDSIKAIAEAQGLFVIEDAAQSFGAEYKGRKACSLADIACTSFFPAKPLGCYGDGGMCFTDDDALAELIKSFRVHGKGADKYDNVRIGINGRLDTLQAAILLAKFEIFREEADLRDQVAARYTNLFLTQSSREAILLPQTPRGLRSVWAQYSLLAKNEAQRADLQAKLKATGIPTAIYYPKPLHLQTAFAALGYKEGDFPVSENFAKRIFSLPMHPYLTIQDQERIVQAIGEGQ